MTQIYLFKICKEWALAWVPQTAQGCQEVLRDYCVFGFCLYPGFVDIKKTE